MSEQKKYDNVSFWPTKSGSGFTVQMSSEVIDALKRIIALGEKAEGSTLFFAELKDEWKTERGPTHRLKVLPPMQERNEAGI